MYYSDSGVRCCIYMDVSGRTDLGILTYRHTFGNSYGRSVFNSILRSWSYPLHSFQQPLNRSIYVRLVPMILFY